MPFAEGSRGTEKTISLWAIDVEKEEPIRQGDSQDLLTKGGRRE